MRGIYRYLHISSLQWNFILFYTLYTYAIIVTHRKLKVYKEWGMIKLSCILMMEYYTDTSLRYIQILLIEMHNWKLIDRNMKQQKVTNDFF